MKKIIFYDRAKEMCEAWEKEFKDIDEVEVQNVGFSDVKAKYVVTDGNSYGIMNEGTGREVRDYFGVEIQDSIQEAIFLKRMKPLDVGKCLMFGTTDLEKSLLVYAPTVDTPGRINKLNVYEAMRGVMNMCYATKGDIAICSLGTNDGISYEDSAKMCHKAYTKYLKHMVKRED